MRTDIPSLRFASPLSLPLLLPSLPFVASRCRAGSVHLQPRIETSTASWPHLIARLFFQEKINLVSACFSYLQSLDGSKDYLLQKPCQGKNMPFNLHCIILEQFFPSRQLFDYEGEGQKLVWFGKLGKHFQMHILPFHIYTLVYFTGPRSSLEGHPLSVLLLHSDKKSRWLFVLLPVSARQRQPRF